MAQRDLYFEGHLQGWDSVAVAKVAAMATAAVPSQKDIPLVEGDAIAPRHGLLLWTSSFGF